MKTLKQPSFLLNGENRICDDLVFGKYYYGKTIMLLLAKVAFSLKTKYLTNNLLSHPVPLRVKTNIFSAKTLSFTSVCCLSFFLRLLSLSLTLFVNNISRSFSGKQFLSLILSFTTLLIFSDGKQSMHLPDIKLLT